MNQIAPSRPGYLFNVADLLDARIGQEQLGRIILEGRDSGDPSEQYLAILAGILKNMDTRNCDGIIQGFSLPVWTQVQILGPNPNRNWLLLQNVGSGDLMVTYKTGNPNPQDFSAASAQAYLTQEQIRAVRVVAGGYFEPIKAPRQAITIFTLGTATQGVACEGQ